MSFQDYMLTTAGPDARDAMQAHLDEDTAADAATTGVWWAVMQGDREVARFPRQYVAECEAADNRDATGRPYHVEPAQD